MGVGRNEMFGSVSGSPFFREVVRARSAEISRPGWVEGWTGPRKCPSVLYCLVINYQPLGPGTCLGPSVLVLSVCPVQSLTLSGLTPLTSVLAATKILGKPPGRGGDQTPGQGVRQTWQTGTGFLKIAPLRQGPASSLSP